MSTAEIFELIKTKIPGAAREETTGAIIIAKDRFSETARHLIGTALDFDNLHCVTAVDKTENIELVYILYSTKTNLSLTIKTLLPVNDLNIESVAGYWRSADWFEREIYDLFGVNFIGHPNLKRILNPDEWTVHPLRKDFARPDFVKKPRY